MLRLDAVSFRHRGAAQDVLDEVSLEVAAGSSTGLLAPSGAGKTTLLRIAALTVRPTAGSVTIGGVPVSGVRHAVPTAVRRSIGVVAQSPRAATNPRLTLHRIIAEPLSFAAGRRTPDPASHAEHIAELADLVQLSPELLDRLPHQVSDGQLQRACLARALALDPKLLLCDEPTAMLDASTTAVVMTVIAGRVERGAAVLIASHDRALLGVTCDRLTGLHI